MSTVGQKERATQDRVVGHESDALISYIFRESFADTLSTFPYGSH